MEWYWIVAFCVVYALLGRLTFVVMNHIRPADYDVFDSAMTTLCWPIMVIGVTIFNIVKIIRWVTGGIDTVITLSIDFIKNLFVYTPSEPSVPKRSSPGPIVQGILEERAEQAKRDAETIRELRQIVADHELKLAAQKKIIEELPKQPKMEPVETETAFDTI